MEYPVDNYVWSSGSALWPSSYFQGSSDSDSNSSISGIYIDPEVNSSDQDSWSNQKSLWRRGCEKNKEESKIKPT